MPVIDAPNAADDMAKASLCDIGVNASTAHQAPRRPPKIMNSPSGHSTGLVKVELVFPECRDDRLTAVCEDETVSVALSVGHEWARGKSSPRLHQYKQRCRTEWPNTINLGLVPRRRQCPNLAVYLTPSHFSSLRTSCGGK